MRDFATACFMVSGIWPEKLARSIACKMGSRLTPTRSGSHGTQWSGHQMITIFPVSAIHVSMIIGPCLHNASCGNLAMSNGL
ncbi:hypothetical protein KTH_12100 [Thermosporothrix hazakensis]|nr:hypothetical protein KTH_11890 [Thermosporothrix hazakensis]GCE46341.1 hypothetical protein KTH_12100 [Thermosporothrix hazakensis]